MFYSKCLLQRKMVIQKNAFNSARIAASFLKQGEVVILPTDTVYGFSGIIPFTKEKICKIKRRDVSKDLIALIAEPSDIFNYTETVIPRTLFDLWPAPLTLIVHDKAGEGTLAFRCPKDEWLRSVIKKTGKPIYSTSVNYSGQSVLTDIGDIKKTFKEQTALIVDGGNGGVGISSTIVSLTGNAPAVIREGALPVSGIPCLFGSGAENTTLN